MFLSKKPKQKKLEFERAGDITEMLMQVVSSIEDFQHVKLDQVYCVRSRHSKARAYARTWGLSRIFQETAGYKPVYVIEVVSRYFDKLNKVDQIKVLIHELMHIPRTFSGALLSHRGPYHRINKSTVEKIYRKITSSR